jgi:hypothetical protein
MLVTFSSPQNALRGRPSVRSVLASGAARRTIQLARNFVLVIDERTDADVRVRRAVRELGTQAG